MWSAQRQIVSLVLWVNQVVREHLPNSVDLGIRQFQKKNFAVRILQWSADRYVMCVAWQCVHRVVFGPRNKIEKRTVVRLMLSHPFRVSDG